MPILMHVHKYIPDRMFGFVIDKDGQEFFFHLGSFDSGAVWVSPDRCKGCPIALSCTWASFAPPPILGEEVDVFLDSNSVTQDKSQAPKALRVARRIGPPAMQGAVETFDPQRGYGFVKGEDGESYHLHSSEIIDNRIPRIGQKVMFFSGIRNGRPRACYVRVCP